MKIKNKDIILSNKNGEYQKLIFRDGTKDAFFWYDSVNDIIKLIGASISLNDDTLEVGDEITILNSTLSVTGATLLNSTLSVTGATTLNNILDVAEATTLNKTLDVTEATTLNSTLDVTDATTLNNTLDVTNATTLNDTLDVTNATTLNDTLDVTEATTLNNTLDVTGNTTLNDHVQINDVLDVTEATTLNNTLDVTGNTTLNDHVQINDVLDVTNATTLNDTLNVTNATTLNDTLDVTNATTLNDTLDVTEATTLNSTLDVTDATTLNNTLDVTNATTLNDTLNVTGSTALNNTLDVTDATTLNDTLNVTGSTALNNTLDVTDATTLNNTLDVTNATTLNDTLDVTNATTLNDTLDVTNATTLNDTLNVINATTLNNTLDVTEATTLNSTLDVTDAATLNNTLDVTNATTLNDTLSVTNATTLNNTLNVTGNTTLNDHVQINDTLDVTDAATLNNTLDVTNATTLNDTLDVTNATTLNDTLDVANATTLNDTLSVTNAATLNDTLDVTGNTTLNDHVQINDILDVTGNVSLGNTLDVTGNTTLNSDLEVIGNTTLQDSVQINDTLNVTGNTTLGNNLTIDGNITQIGSGYDVNIQQINTTEPFIITRDGKSTAIPLGELSGIKVTKYDGINDLIFGADNNGYFSVGEEGSLQILAAREDNPNDTGIPFWNDSLKQFNTSSAFYYNIATGVFYTPKINTGHGNNELYEMDQDVKTNDSPTFFDVHITDPSNIYNDLDHDSLSGFIANEHINHSSVSIIAGDGLTGGGDIRSDKTLNIGTPSTLTNTTINATTNTSHTHAITTYDVIGTSNQVIVSGIGKILNEDITLSLPQDIHTNATPTFHDIHITNPSTAYSDIDHDSLSGFIANEHINHNDVYITAGDGLVGGGNIIESKTLNIGTPSTLTNSTTNATTDSSHTHAITTHDVYGTINQVIVSGTGKILNEDITFSLPQDIHISANPTFNSLTLSNDLIVNGSSVFNDDVQINDILDVTSPVTFGNTLDVTGNTKLNSVLEVVGSALLKDTLNVTGATTLNSTLDVTGATTLNNPVQINDTLDVTGNITLQNHVQINDTLDVINATTLNSTLEVIGNTTLQDHVQINDTLSVTNATTLNSALDVIGNTTLNNPVQINDTLDVTGATTLGNTLNVVNATILGNTLNVTGTTTLNSTLDVTNATTLNSTLDVTGATTLNSTLDVTNVVTLNDTLNVTGATTLNSTLDVTNATTLNSTLDVTGATTLNSTLDVTNATTLNSTLDVTGATTLNNPVQINDILDVTGATTLNNTLDVTGSTTLNNTLDVTGSTTLNSTLDVANDTTLNNILDVTGSTTLNNTLDVTGSTTLNSTLDVIGNTTLNNPVQINDTLDATGATVLNSTLDVTGITNINNDLYVTGDIIQSGSTYNVNVEQVSTTQSMIITRSDAISALPINELSGIKVTKYDGTNDLIFGTGNNGFFRVGEEGSLQILATREDNPNDTGIPFWNNTQKQFNTSSNFYYDSLTNILYTPKINTGHGNNELYKMNQDVETTDTPTFNDINITNPSNIYNDLHHDSLNGFITNEHINHSSVSIIAGEGLTGGGDIRSSKTLNIGTPSTLTNSTTNATTASSHTHNIADYSVSGTSNQVIVSGTGRILNQAITLSLPQDIHTSASPTFNNLNIDEVRFDNLESVSSVNGAVAFDSSEGLLIYRTSMAGNLYSTSDNYLILDGSNISEGPGITITGGKGSTGAPVTFSVNSTSKSHWDDAYTHITSNGTDHTYINQDVRTTSTPTFNDINITNPSNIYNDLHHDSLNGFVANEHIDHDDVSIIAGEGLTGGGDIRSSRTVNMGTPGTLTNSTTNATTASSHTHDITDYGVSGTTNQVLISGTGRILNQAITLSLPQDIHTGATPTFQTLSLNSNNQPDTTDINLSANANIATENSMFFFIDSDNNATNESFYFNTNAAYGSGLNLMTIKEDGNVGIGTTSPDKKLEVQGKTKSTNGFETGDFEMVFNSNTASLDFNYIG